MAGTLRDPRIWATQSSPGDLGGKAPLLASAFDLADKTQRTVYDCVYLALAVRLNGRMVTADQRLYNGLKGTAWAAYICWVADLPAGP